MAERFPPKGVWPACCPPPVSVIWVATERLWDTLEDLMSEFDTLSTDVANLTTAEAGMETRVQAEAQARRDLAAQLQAEIDALKAAVPDIAPQLAGIEAVHQRLDSFTTDLPPVQPVP